MKEEGLEIIRLSPDHNDAVNRRRRIVVQYDAFAQLGADFKQWLDYRFSYIDEPGNQIDSLWWDIGAGSWSVYPSKVLERFEHTGLRRWWEQRIDWVQVLVDESKRRRLEVFWHHRVSEVDLKPTAELEPGQVLMMEELNPVKQEHPDWVIKTWWWQGLWNYAVPEVRQYKLDILRELAENYEFDGIQLDFARHVPCLPPGQQWELRDHVTEFVRMVRLMLLDIEKQHGRPFLLAVKIPRNLDGCRTDGFDVETWAQQNLVDIFTLGSRSMDVDLPAFRRITAGRNIKLQPCFDDHHATDGYQYGPIDFLRGVFGNWWQQGADSMVTFNWSNAPPEACQKIGANPGPLSHRQAYHEVGNPEALAYKDKVFAVERRGGYPWAEGFFGRNDTAPLPATLANDGRPICLNVKICDNVRAYSDRVKQIILRMVLFRTREGDEFEARLNGVVLPLSVQDHQWKDKNIFSPAPQPPSGGADSYQVNPAQKLLRLDFTVSSGQCRLGENQININIANRVPYLPGVDIVIEKIEVHVNYD